MEQRKHDWLATLFFSPDKSIQDLADYGITTDNASIQNIDYYKNIPAIQEAFKTDSGAFDEQKFNTFYNDALYLYNVADNAQVEGNILNTYDYDPLDYLAPIGSKKRNVAPSISLTSNPERWNIGLGNIAEISDPTMSIREVGQTNKVLNYETGEFEEYTPNDVGGLFKGIFRPTLVLAKWDSDGTHEINGRIFEHKAGDLKFNEDGDPYYETLGKRSIAGKDLLHYSDTLTTDGSAWNKYDFFDSDSLDKSVAGIVAKTAFTIAMVANPWTGKFYSGLTAALELGKLMPTLYKSITGIVVGDTSDMESVKTADSIAGYFSRFDHSQSDYARQAGFINLENIGDIIASSSKQLFQQRVISGIPGLFSKKSKDAWSAAKIAWGRGLSFAYMAGTSGQFAYDQFKEAGASDRVAGLGTIATSLAFFGLMKNNYFNYEDVLFGGSKLSKRAINNAVAGASDEIAEIMGYSAETATITREGAAKWVLTMKDKVTDYIKKMNPQDVLSMSFKEGVEETMEEVSTDVIKGVFSGLNSLKLIDKNKDYDFGISPEDMITRYFSSFIGGSIGGATFGLHNKFENSNKDTQEAVKNSNHMQELVYLYRNGKGNDVAKEFKRRYERGLIASRNLSGLEGKRIVDGDKTIIQWEAAKSGESQNDIVYNRITAYLNYIENLVHEENLAISDDQLEKLVSEVPGINDEQKEGLKAMHIAAVRGEYDSAIFTSGISLEVFQDFNNIATQIIQKKAQLEEMLSLGAVDPKTPADVDTHIKKVQKDPEYIKLHNELEALRTKRDNILKGQYNDYYMGLMHFALRPDLVNYFTGRFGKLRWVDWKYGKHYNALSDEEKIRLDQEYAEYAHAEKAEVIEAFKKFSQIQISQNDKLLEIASKMRAEEILHGGSDQYYLIQQNIKYRITENNEKITKLKSELAEGETTSPEIDQLLQKNIELNAALEKGDYSGFSQQISLSEKGQQILKRDAYLDLQAANPQTVEELAALNQAFEDYARSYINYLTHIQQNGLYLDQVDVDMVTILRTLASLTSKRSSNIYQDWIDFVLNFNNHDVEDGASIPYDPEYYDAKFADFVNLLNKFISELNESNISGAINTYYTILTGDALSEFTDNQKLFDEFLNKIFPHIGFSSIISYLTIVQSFKEGELAIKSSPVYELIESISEELGFGEDVVELLIKYQKDFINSPRVEEFIIQDATAIEKLKQLSKIINVARSITLAAKEGNYNDSINPYRIGLKKSDLAKISNLEFHNMMQDFNLIETQVETLISITEKNNAQKLREQKDIEINMRAKFLDLLIGSPSIDDPSVRTSHIKDILKRKLGIDIDALIESLNITVPSEVTENNLKEVIEETSAIETAIYKEAQRLNLSVTDIVSTLFSAFDSKSELIKGKSTKLNKDAKSIISDYDQLLYFATIFGAPSQNFYARLNKVTSDPNFTLAPIFSQEYASRMIYSFIHNPELYNAITNELCTIASKEDSKYLATKSPMWNLFMVLGSAGVGKTQGVVKLSMAILECDNVAICAPEVGQVANLGSSINSDKRYTQQELITKILGKELTDADISEIMDGSVAVSRTLNANVSISSNFIGTDIIIIDEISQFNRIQIELITRWAKKNNIRIIALGDSIQNSATHTMTKEVNGVKKTVTVSSSFDDMLGIKAPRLTAPLRPSNIGKYDNTIRVSSALELIDDHYLDNPTITSENLDTFAEQELSKAPIKLKYYEDATSFYGDKIIDKSQIADYVSRFTTLVSNPEEGVEKPIAIITDNPQEYTSLSSEKIEIVDHNKMQGREFEYVIVVKTFNSTGYKQLKDFYTLTQRSKKGTVIVNSGIPSYITSNLDPSAAGNTSITQENIIEFKNWKLGIISSITEEIQESVFTNSTTVEDADPIIEAQPAQTTGVVPIPTVSESNITEYQNTTPIEELTPNDESTTVSSIIPESVIQNSRSVVPETIPEYDVFIETPDNIICTGEKFMTALESEEFKFYFNQDIAGKAFDQDTTKNYLMLIRAWFVYGHYKDNSKKFPALPNPKLRALPNLINTGKFEFKITNHMLEVIINGELRIPLLYIENIESGEFNGTIGIRNYKNAATFGKHANHFKKVSTVPYMKFSTPMVYSGDKQIWTDSMNSQELNTGQCYVMINADPFSEITFESLMDADDGNILINSPTVQILKVNRLATVNDIFGENGSYWTCMKMSAKQRSKHMLLSGQTAGVMLGLAYSLDPKIIDNALDVFKKNNVIVIQTYGDNYTAKDKLIANNIEELSEILSKINGQKFGIQIGYYFNDKLYIVRGEEALLKLLNGSYKFQQYKELKQAISLSSHYNRGIFVNEIIHGKTWQPTGFNIDNYSSDIISYYGNDFIINGLNVSEQTTTSPSIVDKYNQQLEALRLSGHTELNGYIFTSEDTISTTIDYINDKIKSKLKFPTFGELIISDEKLEIITKTDWEVFISTILNQPIQSVNFLRGEIDPNTLKYELFSVYLQNENKYYIIENTDDGFVIKEVSDNFAITLNNLYAETNKRNWTGYNNAEQYVDKIITNESVDARFAKPFMKYVNDRRDRDLLNAVNLYLLEKLKQNEC